MSKDDFPDSERERKELGITMKREGKESEKAEARVTHEGRKEAMR